MEGDDKITKKLQNYEYEAAVNILDAFNEGYNLGRMQAEKSFKKEQDEQD